MKRSAFLLPLSLACIVLFAFVFAHAQSTTASDDLKATIRAELLKDPRSASLSQAELNTMVDLLANQAQAQGVTSNDIMWRPQMNNTFQRPPSYSCDPLTFLCTFDNAFGFTDAGNVIPIMLGAVSGVLLYVIGMLLHHAGHHATRKWGSA